MANQFKLQVWTGPCDVDHYATLFEAAGHEVCVRGTEHVHVMSESLEQGAAFHNLAVHVEAITGKPLPLRHYTIIR